MMYLRIAFCFKPLLKFSWNGWRFHNIFVATPRLSWIGLSYQEIYIVEIKQMSLFSSLPNKWLYC